MATTPQHKPLAPKRHPGVDSRLRYINCSCGWEGRLTTPTQAQGEWTKHANGVVMEWEIEAAHYSAILEDRRRNEDKDK